MNEVADSEATTFSIFYNNALFLFLFLLLAYLCRSFHPAVYPLCMRVCVLCACLRAVYTCMWCGVHANSGVCSVVYLLTFLSTI